MVRDVVVCPRAGGRIRAQARRVVAWSSAVTTYADGAGFSFMVKNNSEDPVYQVEAAMVPYGSPYAANPEAGIGQVGTLRLRVAVLPPGEIVETRLNVTSIGIIPGPLGFSFSDANGRRWRRLPNGALIGISPSLAGTATAPRVGCVCSGTGILRNWAESSRSIHTRERSGGKP
jgi:hypothetical protein